MVKMKRIAALAMSACLLFCAGGCGKKEAVSDGTVKISIGNWPSKTDEANYERHMKWKEQMKEKYPNIDITPDIGAVDIQTFLTKASSGQLPTLYITYFTEASKIINEGYSLDITKFIDKYGYKDAVKKNIMDMVTSDGKIYGLPANSYAMGLMINMNLFKKAGLVNEDGTPKIPETFEELADYSKIIREKTGKAGFILPTTNNCGGWHFMNIAWSYGVEFMKEENGKYKATFDNEKAVEALQYVKDLKWKYNALPENTFIDQKEKNKLFATDEGAMFLSSPPVDSLVTDYAMDKDSVASATIPAGPKAKVSLMGGGINMVEANATDEQADACFKWLEIIGKAPVVTEDTLKSEEESFKMRNEKGLIVGPEGYGIWDNRLNEDKLTALREKYTNVNMKLFEDYLKFDGVTIKPEEPVNCQELYNILDGIIQEVLNNKNADVKALVAKANSDFQKNYLDI